MGYHELGEAEQVEALRPVALAAAAAFGLEAERLEPVLHGYNTTFAVDERGGRRVALRVGTNSHSTPEHAAAQQAWISAIAAGTPVLVPEPLRAVDGRWFAEVDAPPLERRVLVTAASWLDGADAEELGPDAARALGRAMAELHAQAEHWRPPAGTSLPRLDAPLFGDDDLLATAPGLAAEERAVLDTARSRAADAFARLHRGATLRPLHADLHGGNLKWHAGRLAVFDFDDCGLGLPVLDLAISAFYLRGGDDAAERAMREGYAGRLPLPDVDPADFEALVAARQLLLANALLASSTASLRERAEPYLRTAVARLRWWLETGAFSRAEA
ncbi:phosphotransferase enzyme family protein [Agrococcus sp. HG114]|uniref:phosphotransferase enzyme family protein n=1 Tax=Agrococcus sp. HG114 TaxID=2969757 RepID=UPI00215B31F3|nr:phosphotransferase [Agrococcus sp. HG114]MCR8670585.1 phosphotransferase [Agrococcus sp. HG114]